MMPLGHKYPVTIAIEAYLQDNVGTARQISEATGISPNRVKCAISRLKRDESPVLRNLRQKVYQLPEIVEPEEPLPDAETIIASAIRSRSPLEIHWAA